MKKFDPQTQIEFVKLLRMLLITSLIVQIVTLVVYYFFEKQVVLTFPMLLSIFCNGIALFYAFAIRD